MTTVSARIGSTAQRSFPWMVFAVEGLLLVLTILMLTREPLPYEGVIPELTKHEAADIALVQTYQASLLLMWVLVAAFYLGVGAVAVRRASRSEATLGHQPDVWEKLRLGGVFRGWFPTVVSLTGLTMGLWVMATSKGKKERLDVFAKVTDPDAKAILNDLNQPIDAMIPLAVLSVLLSWMLLHAGYARMYSRMCHLRWPGALRFPGTEHPSLTDYLYFSFCMGSTFATSDVEVRAPRMRWHVMVHSVMSFFYNAVVMAIAIKLITEGWN